MIKIVYRVLATICFGICTLLAQETKVDWNKNYRISATSSAALFENASFHIISFRDTATDDYGLLPIFEKEGSIQKGEGVPFQTEPNVVAFHTNKEKNQLVLIVEHQQKKSIIKKLEMFVFDIATGKINSKKNLSNFKTRDTFISDVDKIIRLHSMTDSLMITTIKGDESIDSVAVEVQNDYVFSEMVKKGIQWVNQNEFIKHGSTHPSKVYLADDQLHFSLKTSNRDKLLTFSLNDPTKKLFREFEMENANEIRDSSSFIYDGKIFLFLHNVNNIEIDIYDIKTGIGLKRYTLLKDFKKQINRTKFLPLMQQLVQPKYQLTATVNKGVNGNVVIDLDYVDNENYRYESRGKMFNNLWFHQMFIQQMHMQQIQMQQQQWMNNQIRNFSPGGPNAAEYEMMPTIALKKDDPKLGVKIVLNEDLSIPEVAETETHFKDIDREMYIKLLEKSKKGRHISILERSDEYLYLYYSKSNKAFYLGAAEY